MGRRKGSGKGVPITQPKGGKRDLQPSERAEVLRLRTEAGMTQDELGAKAGVSSGTISNIETGSTQVNKSVYMRVIRALTTKKKAISASDKAVNDALSKIAEHAAFLELDDIAAVVSMSERLANARKPKDT